VRIVQPARIAERQRTHEARGRARDLRVDPRRGALAPAVHAGARMHPQHRFGVAHVAGGGDARGQHLLLAVAAPGIAQPARRAQPYGESPAAAGLDVEALQLRRFAMVVPGKPQQPAAQRGRDLRVAVHAQHEAGAARLVFGQLHHPARHGEVAALHLRRQLPRQRPARMQPEQCEAQRQRAGGAPPVGEAPPAPGADGGGEREQDCGRQCRQAGTGEDAEDQAGGGDGAEWGQGGLWVATVHGLFRCGHGGSVVQGAVPGDRAGWWGCVGLVPRWRLLGLRLRRGNRLETLHFTPASPHSHSPATPPRQPARPRTDSLNPMQSDPQWDLVIVGASFPGAACALAARAAGLRVCVLERKRAPGIRLHTTGIIVREAAEGTALARIPAPLVRRIDGVRLYAPNLRSMALQRRGYYFLATDTPAVMRWLADELERAGVELRLMQSFTDARRGNDGWQVDGLGGCRWLVGADGAKSRVAMRAGLGRVRGFLYGVEHEFEGATLAEPDRLHCFIDRALAPGYIGWAAQNPRGVQL